MFSLTVRNPVKELRLIGQSVRLIQTRNRGKGSNMGGVVEQSIKEKLSDALSPAHLDVINESYMHNVPKGSETHFKVVIVADAFEGKPLIQRHRLVNATLKEELEGGVHALSINAITPRKWKESGKDSVTASPNCLGGSKR
eukprot:Nk52_evm57s217 gene=Nk52_evmTU57s217